VGLKNWTGQGPNYVPAYQASGTPYVTSSNGANISSTPVKIQFPFVTRFVEIRCTGNGSAADDASLRIGFSANGVGGNGGSVSGSAAERASPADNDNYFILDPSGSTGRLELRCKELYLQRHGSNNTGYTLIAGLTGIDYTQFPTLTGSAGFRGIG